MGDVRYNDEARSNGHRAVISLIAAEIFCARLPALEPMPRKTIALPLNFFNAFQRFLDTGNIDCQRKPHEPFP